MPNTVLFAYHICGTALISKTNWMALKHWKIYLYDCSVYHKWMCHDFMWMNCNVKSFEKRLSYWTFFNVLV